MTTKAQSSQPPQPLSLGQPIPIATHSLPSHASSSQTNVSGSAGTAAAAAASHSGVGSGGSTTSSSHPTSSSLVNPTSLALSLPYSQQSLPIIHVDSQALQYLTLEMPNALRASTKSSLRRRRKGLSILKDAGYSIDGLMPPTGAAEAQAIEEEVIHRLETIGSHVGANFAERLSRDRGGFATTLDVLKFICKEVWTAIWEKQVDNLRTNHRGVYVLQDNVFKPLLRISLPASNTQVSELVAISKIQLAYPVGIIRGALGRLGVASTVVAETTQIPQCEYDKVGDVITLQNDY